jgi:Fe-S-cluster-containing dehydrogenase component
MSMGFLINNADCYGCKTCMLACKSEKQLGTDVLLRHVHTYSASSPASVLSFASVSCNHCDTPACMAACPVGAISKDASTGIVTIDEDLCTGCQGCVDACPFHAPCYDAQSGKAYKCDMCVDRQADGLQPQCVTACPGMNLSIGEMSDLESANPGAVVGDDTAGTGPNYVLIKDSKLQSVSLKYADMGTELV